MLFSLILPRWASITLFTTVSLVQPASTIPHTEPSPVRDVEQYDISKKGLALDGYDPVAYFTENKPVRGSGYHVSNYN